MIATILSIYFRFARQALPGEDLIIGHLGNFFIFLSFFASLFAAIAYYNSNRSDVNNYWKKLANGLFVAHAVSVISIFVLLFIMILKHKFEYHYAWRHSSTELPLQYIISCFWEGQEGSFLLWQFWHAVLGVFLIFRLKDLLAPVMTSVSLIQVVLGSMILGLYLFGTKIGSNPFILLRDVMHDAPIFSNPNYLSLIADGNGLNPLLQNYWMVIHPPVLFLGFAASLLPFSFCLAGLWNNEYKKWLPHAISWSLFSGGVLGIGILMGGAWAYESLSFGGFWAWDPVENASLVPWLILIAGLHTLVAYRASGHGLFTSYLLIGLSYFFVLLSTFLTRSGILGDTSVHSFTDLGLFWQLVFFLLFLTIPYFILLGIRNKNIPRAKKEEKTFSREFWIFVGSLILLSSSILITYTTCIPLWNKLFGLELAPPANPEQHHNGKQIYIAIIVALLSAVTQFMFYKREDVNKLLRKLFIPSIISIVLSVAISFALSIKGFQYQLLLFAGIYSLILNSSYLFTVMKLRIMQSGASITHIGFALMLIGILISQYK